MINYDLRELVIVKFTLGVDYDPCGLIINELVSNCPKHAFPDEGGEINITLHTRGEHEINLAVTDNGVGIHTT